jgi:hypothetical protein
MATHHGKEGVVKTGSNVTGEVTAFTLETTGDVVEDTSLSDSAKTFIAGRTSFSGSIEAHFDETDTSQEAMVVGTELAFTLLPEGSTAGDASYTGQGIVTGMSISNTMDGIVSRSITFQGTGALAVGTV